jgi:hypothetical protein
MAKEKSAGDGEQLDTATFYLLGTGPLVMDRLPSKIWCGCCGYIPMKKMRKQRKSRTIAAEIDAICRRSRARSAP